MDPPRARCPRKHVSKKSTTDPFQVFCAENRPEISSLNPNESVGMITSILASMWRSMSPEKKIPYVEFAKQFDRSQQVFWRPSRPPAIKEKKISLVLPSIYVVKRIGCSSLIQEASLSSLTHAMEERCCGRPILA
jgi:hypothetical protein